LLPQDFFDGFWIIQQPVFHVLDELKAITRRHHVFLGSSWIHEHCLFTHLRFKNEKYDK